MSTLLSHHFLHPKDNSNSHYFLSKVAYGSSSLPLNPIHPPFEVPVLDTEDYNGGDIFTHPERQDWSTKIIEEWYSIFRRPSLSFRAFLEKWLCLDFEYVFWKADRGGRLHSLGRKVCECGSYDKAPAGIAAWVYSRSSRNRVWSCWVHGGHLWCWSNARGTGDLYVGPQDKDKGEKRMQEAWPYTALAGYVQIAKPLMG